MTKKGLGDTVLGWFVVREGDEDDAPSAAETPELRAEQLVPQYKRKPAPPPDAAAPPSVKLDGDIPTVAAGAAPDAQVFVKVFSAAQITEEAQQRVEKALSLLGSLPMETPKDTRKQIVEASFKAFGIPLDDIIETAAEEIQALEAFIQHGARHTETVLTDANMRIEKLAAQINEIKKLMEMQVRSQQMIVKSSNDQKLRIQSVLEFFGQEAVARVVQQSAKLVSPKE